MKKNPASHFGVLNPHVLIAFALCYAGVFLAALGFAATPTPAGWSLITSPNPTPTNNPLSSVACASANDCWAIGGGNITLHWNGTSWSTVASPSANGAVLNSVACASSSECWAVGYYNNGTMPQTLIERWDGNSWSIFASPNNGPHGSELYSVTCTSESDCWAVGYNPAVPGPSTLPQTLAERWNGTSWTIVPTLNHTIGGSPVGSTLYGIACPSASDCWAVGGWNDGESGDSLFEHWNGTTWSISTSFPSTGIGLTSVACASTSECLAVSTASLQSGQPLIELWNGSTWAIVPSPVPSPSPDGDHQLFSVTCGSASECWAVGYNNNGVAAQTLIQKWDGSSWSIVSSPNNGTLANYLYGVACASASQCWAVGFYNNNSGQQTLIEEFAPTIPPLTGVVSRKVHGSAGTFDIDLPLIGPRGVECRSPGATGTLGVDHKIVFSFVNSLTRCGTASAGSLSSGPNSNQCTVDLTGVANQQYVTVTLSNVLDSQTNTGTVSATMGVLLGDVSANGVVTNTDVSVVKGQVNPATPVTQANCREDVTVNGFVTNTDVSVVKGQVNPTGGIGTP